MEKFNKQINVDEIQKCGMTDRYRVGGLLGEISF